MRVAHFYFTAHVRYNTMSITAQRATKGNIAMALASAGKSLTEIAPALKRVETRLNGDVAKASSQHSVQLDSQEYKTGGEFRTV